MRNLMATLLTTLIVSTSVYAQSTQGSIVGTVTDTSGAGIPSAAVKLRNEGTNQEWAMQTGGDGEYRFSGLLPGFYAVTINVTGFKGFTQTQIDLNTAQVKRVDVRLDVGDIASTVTVEGAVSQLETEAATLSNIKTSRDFTQLPLSVFGRGWANVTTVVAGVHSRNGQFVVNGARDTANNFTSDGISVNDVISSRNTANGFSGEVEVLQEVKIQTANNSAEYAQVAQFNAVTKSGTNDLHGSLYWGNFNSKFSARSFFDRTSPAFTNHNMFAATNGGPVYIPRLYNGKDKTFYFVSYGGARYRVGARQIITLPNAAFRDGDFSGIANQVTVLDPLTGSPFPNNRIPANRISPVSRAIQDLIYPDPNQPGTGNLGVVANYFADPGGRFDSDVWSFRVDHRISDKNTIFTRVGVTQNNKNWYPGPLNEGLGQNSWQGNNPGRSVVVSDTHAFTPVAVNEIKLGFHRIHSFWTDTTFGEDFLSRLGLQGISNPANDPSIGGMPSISFGGGVPFAGTATWANGNSQTQNTWNVIDNFSWFRGRHTIKIGGDIRRHQINDQVKPQSLRGAYTFDDNLSGFAYANFLLGYPSSARRSIARPNAYPRSTHMGAYIQDDIRVNQRITLNVGLRYEYQTPWVDRYDRMFTFLPQTNQVVTAGNTVPSDLVPAVVRTLPSIVPGSQAGLPERSLLLPDRNNINPRIGIAIRPFNDTTTVFRAGYGMYTQMWPGLLALRLTGGPWQSDEDFFLENARTPTIQFPSPFVTTSRFSGLQTISGVNPNFPNERTHQWTASLGRQIWGMALDIGYVGTKVLGIPHVDDLNLLPPSQVPFDAARRPFQQFNSVNFTQTGGQSIYHGLTVMADRRMSRGLWFNANYTWAKALSDVDLRSFAPSAQQNQYDRRLERGPDPNVREHMFRTTYTWELPIGRGQMIGNALPGAVNAVIGGWQLSGILSMYSGQWLSPTFSGTDPANTNQFGGRPDRVGFGILDWNGDTIRARQPIFDVNAFARPATSRGFYGNSGRNILQGPGEVTWNAVLAKNFFPFGERARFQFRWELFNALNRANFNNPNTNINSGAFGMVTSAQAGRAMLFGLRADY